VAGTSGTDSVTGQRLHYSLVIIYRDGQAVQNN